VELKTIGKIIFQIGSKMYGYEKPDEQIYDYLVNFTGGREIVTLPPENRKIDVMVEEETFPNIKQEYYQPSEEEIEEYIKSNTDYRHGVRKILTHFNKRDLQLDHNNKELNKMWYNTRMKANRVRNRISNDEIGQWEEKRVSRGKEYLFVKN